MKLTKRFFVMIFAALLLKVASIHAQTSAALVLVSNVTGNDDLYLLDIDANVQTNLTNNPAKDWNPDWSPDGSQIVFASDRTGDADIFVLSLRGLSVTNLTNNPAMDVAPAWSPDGSQIAFVSNRSGGYDLYLYTIQTNTFTQVTFDGADKSAPDWSPDGSQIVFWATEGGEQRLFIVTLATGERRRVGMLTRANFPAWSPDGSQIAVMDLSSGTSDIVLVNVATGDEENLTNTPAVNEARPAWNPDASVLAYGSDQAGYVNIFLRRLDIGVIMQVTSGAADENDPAFFPLSDQLFPQMSGSSGDTPSLSLSAIELSPGSDVSGSESAGTGIAELFLSSTSIAYSGAVVVRLEVRADGIETTGAGGTLEASRDDIEIHTIMGAELQGVDLPKFVIDPTPTNYVLRLDLEEVNYWEWLLRPAVTNAIGTNYFSVLLYVPRVQPDGTVGREVVARVRFEIEITPDQPQPGALVQTVNPTPSISPTTIPNFVQSSGFIGAVVPQSAPPTRSFAIYYTTVDTFVVMSMGSEDLSTMTVTGAGYEWGEIPIADYLPPEVVWQQGVCIVFDNFDRTLSPLPRACDRDLAQRYTISSGDVFWFDPIMGTPRPVLVRYQNTVFTCQSSRLECNPAESP